MLCRKVECDKAVLQIILQIGLAIKALRDTTLRMLNLHGPHFCSSDWPRMLRYLPARRDSPFSRQPGTLLCSPKLVLVSRIFLFMSAGVKLINLEDELDLPDEA